MDIIELGSAEPQTPLLPFKEFVYPISAKAYLPVPSAEKSENFFEILERRSTRREFKAISLEKISNLLWYSAKVKATKSLGSGHVWQHRSTPSAGGRHPIDILIISRVDDLPQVQIYDPIAHAVGDLSELPLAPVEEFCLFLEANFEVGDAVIFWFAAQIQKTSAAYKNATGLIYRDAGALETTMALTAEALGLNYCSIGLTGEPWVSQFLHSEGLVHGVGGILIGNPPDHPNPKNGMDKFPTKNAGKNLRRMEEL